MVSVREARVKTLHILSDDGQFIVSQSQCPGRIQEHVAGTDEVTDDLVQAGMWLAVCHGGPPKQESKQECNLEYGRSSVRADCVRTCRRHHTLTSPCEHSPKSSYLLWFGAVGA